MEHLLHYSSQTIANNRTSRINHHHPDHEIESPFRAYPVLYYFYKCLICIIFSISNKTVAEKNRTIYVEVWHVWNTKRCTCGTSYENNQFCIATNLKPYRPASTPRFGDGEGSAPIAKRFMRCHNRLSFPRADFPTFCLHLRRATCDVRHATDKCSKGGPPRLA